MEGDGIYAADGHMVWDLKGYAFESGDAPCPDTVNPSLWRQAQLNNIHGLFKVMDGVYQVRNLDMGNMTIVEGKTGIIVIDCMTFTEAAKAAIDLYYKHVGKKDIKAICITHSHTDQYGALLDKSPRAQVDAGLGKSLGVNGTVSIFPPSHIIKQPVETHVLDGVTFEFMLPMRLPPTFLALKKSRVTGGEPRARAYICNNIISFYRHFFPFFFVLTILRFASGFSFLCRARGVYCTCQPALCGK